MSTGTETTTAASDASVVAAAIVNNSSPTITPTEWIFIDESNTINSPPTQSLNPHPTPDPEIFKRIIILFPPKIKPSDLICRNKKNGELLSRATNKFLIYRNEYSKELSKQLESYGCNKLSIREVSRMAAMAWKKNQEKLKENMKISQENSTYYQSWDHVNYQNNDSKKDNNNNNNNDNNNNNNNNNNTNITIRSVTNGSYGLEKESRKVKRKYEDIAREVEKIHVKLLLSSSTYYQSWDHVNYQNNDSKKDNNNNNNNDNNNNNNNNNNTNITIVISIILIT
ncbi:hypothetical protein Glove_198g16 [Diversispora epigaea]|uniref:HMG box domain-containing protein n=1 Tax=Diversispora epigaea TaxID=1348612 RepID=A0A397IKB0_9GLOM|nr:hypothetical protein Glove_198g16 [Diversispora epigaea]